MHARQVCRTWTARLVDARARLPWRRFAARERAAPRRAAAGPAAFVQRRPCAAPLQQRALLRPASGAAPPGAPPGAAPALAPPPQAPRARDSGRRTGRGAAWRRRRRPRRGMDRTRSVDVDPECYPGQVRVTKILPGFRRLRRVESHCRRCCCLRRSGKPSHAPASPHATGRKCALARRGRMRQQRSRRTQQAHASGRPQLRQPRAARKANAGRQPTPARAPAPARARSRRPPMPLSWAACPLSCPSSRNGCARWADEWAAWNC